MEDSIYLTSVTDFNKKMSKKPVPAQQEIFRQTIYDLFNNIAVDYRKDNALVPENELAEIIRAINMVNDIKLKKQLDDIKFDSIKASGGRRRKSRRLRKKRRKTRYLKR